MTYEEFMELAKQNYCNGGDGYYECWDEAVFEEYVSLFGPITKRKAKAMFKTSKAIDNDRAGW